MNVDEALEAVETVLLSRKLSPVERLVLRQSWFGQTYGEMAQDSAYGIPHIKEIGSRLWHELSQALGERVTKKNLHLLLARYQPNQIGEQHGKLQPEYQTYRVANNNFTDSVPQAVLEFPSGPVPLHSPLYIYRPPIEELAYTEISQPGCVIRIKAPRKMGKSSLLNRIVAHSRVLGYKTVTLDFQEADETIFASLDKFLRWFCVNVSRQLNLNPRLDEFWDEDMGSKVNCKIYFEGYLLEQINSPLVLALNELHQIFEHSSIAQEFLPMLRFWHEQARAVETWQKLRLVVVHATEISIPLKLNQSPFNVGLSIKLTQFTSSQVQELARRYGLDWTDESEMQKLMAMVGGHPYLVNVALYHLCRGNMTLEELLQAAPTPAGMYSGHLRSHLTLLREDTQLVSAMQQVVNADESVQLEAIAAYKLESMGLVELDGNQAKPSCELYRLYFRNQLGDEHVFDARLSQPEQAQQDVQPLRNIDQLTQLPNQRHFNQYLEIQWQQLLREALPLSLIMCDIDYFRFYNEAYGEPAGDICLQQVASTIRSEVKHQAAVVARYGGEEFAVLLPQTDANTAMDIAETIRESIKALAIALEYPGVGGFPDEVLTVSLGVASTVPSAQTSLEKLVDVAEDALYKAKRLGRDRVSLGSL